MVRAFVRLLCPECGKDWETNSAGLPAHRDNYSRQNCDAARHTAEFMRTERDLQTLKQPE